MVFKDNKKSIFDKGKDKGKENHYQDKDIMKHPTISVDSLIEFSI